MAIIRACSYSVAIDMPEPPTNYSRVVVTFAQNQRILVSKELAEMSATDDGVFVELTQEETARFRPSEKSPMGRLTGSNAFMQIRAYKEPTDAPGSECWEIPVLDSLNQEVLSDD